MKEKAKMVDMHDPSINRIFCLFVKLTLSGSNTVDSPALSGNQRLTIDETEISDDFDELMRVVTKVYGLPVSYLKVYQANLLQMYIPPRSKRGKLKHIHHIIVRKYFLQAV